MVESEIMGVGSEMLISQSGPVLSALGVTLEGYPASVKFSDHIQFQT
jgi:hypothetical protein